MVGGESPGGMTGTGSGQLIVNFAPRRAYKSHLVLP